MTNLIDSVMSGPDWDSTAIFLSWDDWGGCYDQVRPPRIDPATDGRPDNRPDVRENAPLLGNLSQDFNFAQSPRPPLLLPVDPVTTLRS